MQSILQFLRKGKASDRPAVQAMWIFVVLCMLLFAISCEKTDYKRVPTNPDLQLLTDNLVSPLGLVESPDATRRLFVIDQVGKVWIVNAEGGKTAVPFLDVSSRMVTLSPGYDERGLLGFAFHPDFKRNGRVFVFYNAPPRPGGPSEGVNWNNLCRISEFRVSGANPNLADLGSEKVILEIDHPQANHNGGTIAFGPDGYLYISVGDGGNRDDMGPGHVNDWYTVNVGGNGQDVYANLLGDVLRIDVNSGSPYGIPADNPFVGKPGRDEIYAYGFRNPYRFSFDMGGSHQLYLGDAGQVLYEEVDIVRKGGNYGWNVKEGTHCFNTDNNRTERASCPMVDSAGNPLIDPIIEFANINNPRGGIASTVVGGNVYRGSALPEFKGRYIFGVFSQGGPTPNGKIFMSDAGTSGSGLWSFYDIALRSYPNNLGQYVKGFGQDLSGEIYVTTSGVAGPSGTTGKVFKLINVK